MFMLMIRTMMIYIFIIALMRLMGKRQLAELQPSELVSTILISNLASLSIESPEIPLAVSLLPVLLIVSLELLLSALCFKSPKTSSIISGKPIMVIQNGVIDQKALKDLRFSIRDLMEALRAKEIFDPADVQYALIETNGSLSVCKAAIGQDKSESTKTVIPIVIDGIISYDNLTWCKKSPDWLGRILGSNHCDISQVLLLLGNDTDWYRLIKKESR